ncbi:3-keto-disaccharide hydrolase [Pedobacter sp. GR22-6]|uniref:3-keto-disaccharide hydrolase n=1 Tax=Pedobacter sp. GR22-6 TaxID=3127957 RepID=UPI00307F034A
MKLNYLRLGTTAFVWLLGTAIVSGQQLADQPEINLNDLASFKTPGQTWTLAGGVVANLNEQNALTFTKGTGVLVNLPTKKNNGSDLFTVGTHGDLVLELDYLLAKGANSGIYFQGAYELQLEDSWTKTTPLSSTNGGIYERWDDSKPEGQKGFEGYAPRQNVSKAPGVWQHLKVVFLAPRFDAAGNKTANAKFVTVELNGVQIHDNVQLFGSTRGGAKESASGPLRLQGDHGAVAFKNIKISKLNNEQLNSRRGGSDADPILIEAPVNTMIRSFVDISGGPRVVHAISIGSPQKVHYAYDLDNGLLFHAWRGDFVDATPMWDGRGNGSSRPRGTVTTFFKKPAPTLAKLADANAVWPVDTTGTSFRTKGYTVDTQDRPTFQYNVFGAKVTDQIRVTESGEGLIRSISTDKPVDNLYALLAEGSNIEDLGKGLYLINGQSYLKFEDPKTKPVIREANGKKELVVLLRGQLNYSILF